MSVITAAAGGGDWTTGGTWVGGVAPTSADDAVLDATSGNVAITFGSVCRSLNCTGYTGTLAFTDFTSLSIGDGTAGAGNVALLLSAGMTLTLADFNSFIFASTSGTQQTISTGGKTLPGLDFYGDFSSHGNHVFASNVTCGGISVLGGTLNGGGYDVSADYLIANASSASTTITLGNGTWTLNSLASGGGGNRVLEFNSGAHVTVNCNSSTILVNYTGATDFDFRGGGKTFNVVQVAMGGAGVLIFEGSNTFAKLERSGTGTKNIRFTAGTTQTLTGGSDCFFSGTSGNLITIDTDSAGTDAAISKSSGTIESDYLSLKDSEATGGATFYAGDNSTDVSGNSGWVFTAPAPTGSPWYAYAQQA